MPVSKNQIVYKMEKYLINGQHISFESRILHLLELFKIAVTCPRIYTPEHPLDWELWYKFRIATKIWQDVRPLKLGVK